MQGSFGYELDLSKLSEEDKAEARRQITVYNENWELFQSGSYYRLNSPMENHDYTAWSYVSKDQRKASLSVIYTDLHGNPKPVRVKLKGPEKRRLLRCGRNRVYRNRTDERRPSDSETFLQL